MACVVRLDTQGREFGRGTGCATAKEDLGGAPRRRVHILGVLVVYWVRARVQKHQGGGPNLTKGAGWSK